MKLTVTFLLAACLLLNSAFAQDYETCEEDEHQMDPPECPDHEEGLPTYYPYPYDCTKYFECTNGDARCIQCPNGTVWDQELTVCNHEMVVDCNIITTIRTTPTTTTTTTTTTTPTTTTTTPTTTTPTTTTPTTTTTTEAPTTEEDIASWICPENYIGRMGHPYNCSFFYICDPGRRPCLFACTPGLYYDPVTMDCQWPWDVPSCVDGTPPPPTPTTPRTNYRNMKRLQTAKQSFFSFFSSIFQEEETTTQGSAGPCDEPTLAQEYHRIY